MPCYANRPVGKSAETQTEIIARNRRLRRERRLKAQANTHRYSYKREKKTKIPTVQKAVGAEGLENCRFGPDVIIDYLECTPLALWNCEDPHVDYNEFTEKESIEIIPVSPKEEKADPFEVPKDALGKSSILAQRSPPTTWVPDLTELEEDEFDAEAALIVDNFKLAYCLPLENEAELFEKMVEVVQILRPDGTIEYKDRVKVVLSETETEYHIQIGGRIMLDNGTEEAEEMKRKNERYARVCQHHIESDAYCDRHSQTFSDRERDKYSQLVGVGVLDKSQHVNDYIMFDDYMELERQERDRKAREEAEAIRRALEEAEEEQEEEEEEVVEIEDAAEKQNFAKACIDIDTNRQCDDNQKSSKKGGICKTYFFTENSDTVQMDIPTMKTESSSDEDEEEEEDPKAFRTRVDWDKMDECFAENEVFFPPQDMNDLDEELELGSDEELDVKVELDNLYAKRLEKALKSRPKLLPNISYSVLILERVASTNKYQSKHMEIRGFDPIFKRELTRRQMYQLRNDALVESGPTLKRFWAYKPNLTRGLEVTSISIHPTNGNLIAASYGSNAYPSLHPTPGLVCVWNVKNINLPERTYHFETSATVVLFSNMTPYFLAIGLLDGNVFVYDVRNNEPRIVCSTERLLERPFGPIWDLFWLKETTKNNVSSTTEVLISVSDDGCLHRWTPPKGFELMVLLKVRRSPLKIPGRREKRAEALISQWSASYTICFYPDDLTTYLIGTEEGFIHKCTTSYVEQFVTTYVSHTGPVYAIRFSPFAKDIFISCGGDWCVKIWKEDFPSAPLLTLCSGLRAVFDVAWAPTMSSVFVCANELHMEIWDVTVNTLEPIIQFKLPNLGLRRVCFYAYVQGLLIGDHDGGITVYSLRSFPEQPETLDDKIDHLLEGLIPGYKRQMVEELEPEEEGKKLFLTFNDLDGMEASGEEEEEEEEEEEKEPVDTNLDDDTFDFDVDKIFQSMSPVEGTPPLSPKTSKDG